MDVFQKDSTVTRAMALALMRQALDMLVTAGETAAATKLRGAIDALLGKQD